MRKRTAPLAACLAAAGLVGCFDGERVIKVNADGSGSVEDTLILGRQLRALMVMAERAGEDEAAERKAKLEATAAAMGPGVALVSEELSEGRLRAVYAFEDIAPLTLEVSPGPPGGEEEPPTSQQPPLTFRFEKRGGRSVLTVVQPRPEKLEGEEAESVEGVPDLAAGIAQGMWGMMKGMLKGLKLRTRVVVNGEILETNAVHREGAAVTLLEMDFDAITADEANFEKFTKAGGDPESMDPALLQGVAGVRVNPAREITIEFRGS